MRIRELAGAVAVACIMAAPVWAKPPHGHGGGRPETAGQRAKKAADRVAGEAVDAVADELTGTTSSGSSGMPPGLAKKGKMPPGLAKQGKTPPGWDKGRKEGWNGQQPKKESLIRRAVRGIFRRGSKSGQGSTAPPPTQ